MRASIVPAAARRSGVPGSGVNVWTCARAPIAMRRSISSTVARVATTADDERALAVRATRDDGVFAIGALPPGPHAVVAVTSDGRCGGTRVMLEVGEQRAGLEIAVVPGAKLRCVNDHAWRALSIGVVHDDVDYGGDEIAAGDAVELTVPAGRSIVTVRDRIGRVVRSVDVTLKVGETQPFAMGDDTP